MKKRWGITTTTNLRRLAILTVTVASVLVTKGALAQQGDTLRFPPVETNGKSQPDDGGQHYDCLTPGSCSFPPNTDPSEPFKPRPVGPSNSGLTAIAPGNGADAPSTCSGGGEDATPTSSPASGFPVVLATGTKLLEQQDFIHRDVVQF